MEMSEKYCILSRCCRTTLLWKSWRDAGSQNISQS